MAAPGRDDDIPLVERIIDDIVFRPFEVAAQLATAPPREIGKRVRQARSDVRAARVLGKLAVDHGVRRLRAELADRLDRPEPRRSESGRGGGTRRHSTAGAGHRRGPAGAATDAGRTPAATASGEVDGDSRSDVGAPAPDVDQLALPDYDSLSAADINRLLGGLDRGERDAVEAYELANRHRRTVLGKLDQLRDAS